MNYSKKMFFLPFFVTKCFLHLEEEKIGNNFVTIPSWLIYVDAAEGNCVAHLNPSWTQYRDTLCIALVIRSWCASNINI